MKKLKLHQHFILVICIAAVFAACSKKTLNISSTRTKTDFEASVVTDSVFMPAAVIIVPDDKAKTNKEDELYYDDENGYRYWRYNDGKYYLDKKYSKPVVQKKRASIAKLTAPQM